MINNKPEPRGSAVFSGLAAVVMGISALLVATSVVAQVFAVDKYRVSAQKSGPGILTVTGLPGSVPPAAELAVFNTRTWDSVPMIAPAPDGSFTAQIGGLGNDPLSVVVTLDGTSGPPTFFTAGKLVIKNPYRPGGHWWVGQGHTHTTNSDGANSPTTVEAAYFLAGYHFVVSTDHRGWPTPVYTATDDGMTPDPNLLGVQDLLWIRGAEIGNYQMHLGAWGTSANVPLNDIVDTQRAVNATRNLGGIAVIHHPENLAGPYAWDWHDEIVPARDLSLIEAFNGNNGTQTGEGESPPNHLADAIDLADEFQQVWWIGTDDSHNVLDAARFNLYAIVVQTDSATINQNDILSSADAGRLYIRQSAQGPAITGVSVAGNVVTLTLPDIDSGYEVTWYKRGNEEVKRDAAVDTESSYSALGSEGYVRAEVRRLSDSLRAFTQPMFVADSKDLAVSASVPALVDNNSTTAWDAGAQTGSFIVDAGSVRNLNAIRIDWDGTGGRRFNYAVEVSDTGEFGGEEVPVVRRTYSNRIPLTLDFFDARSRYVRVLVTGQSMGSPGNARVREVELLASSPARTNLYISNEFGSDANSGSASSPWKTFNHARERVRPRDTLNFMQTALPYPGGMQLSAKHSGKHAGATVQYSGAGGVPARIDSSGQSYGVTLSGVEWLKWTDFEISLAASANLFVTNTRNTEVLRNRLHSSSGRGVLGAGEFTLGQNLIYGNGTDGVFLYTDGTNARIENNVIFGNGVDGLAMQNVGTVNASIQNNIVAGNGRYAFWRDFNGTVTDSHNCVQGTYAYVGAWSRASSILADPRFTDPANGDFSLQLTSPCIDAGIDLNYVADFNGDPIRDVISVPDTGSPGAYSRTYADMGAFEACDTCTSGGGCHQ